MSPSEYEVLVVRHGTRTTTRSEVYLNYPQYNTADAPHVVDYYFWVVRNTERTVLVDTGYSAGPAARRGRSVLVDPAAAYRELGINLDAPLDIIVTHAHYDHIGNLNLFPHARIIIARSELDFWKSDLSAKTLITHFVERGEIDVLTAIEDEGRASTFSGRWDLAPGIEIIEVGGHTPGQSMVKVSTSGGTVLLASDAVHFREELSAEMPFVSVTDLLDMYRGFATINAMTASGEIDIVVPGHDADVLGTIGTYSTASGSALYGLVGVIGGIQP